MEEAAARRERLKALKAAAALADGGGDAGAGNAAGGEEQQEPERPTLKFRNYIVKDKAIEHEQVGNGTLCTAGHAGRCCVRASAPQAHGNGCSAKPQRCSTYVK